MNKIKQILKNEELKVYLEIFAFGIILNAISCYFFSLTFFKYVFIVSLVIIGVSLIAILNTIENLIKNDTEEVKENG